MNELNVLIHDKSLSNHKRHKRFMQLVEKCIASPSTILEGSIDGTDMLWARASFELEKVQLNKFNKLVLEVFSKLSGTVKIESIELITNIPELNKTIDFM